MMDIENPTWIERHLLNIIAGACTLVGVMGIVIIIMAVQVMDLNARLIAETKQMRIELNTHEARIRALAAENAWVREKVRIGGIGE